MTRSEALAYRDKVVVGEAVEAVGGMRESVEQSDKLGYDLKQTYVNDVLVYSEYVPQTEPKGTADNPIVYTDGVALINNAYYIVDGVRKVYMDGEFIAF